MGEIVWIRRGSSRTSTVLDTRLMSLMDLVEQVKRDPSFSSRYEIGEKIGGGGMGTVYRGIQKSLDRPVAIKFMAPELRKEPGYPERFLAEAKVASALVHSNVVGVFDHGLAQDVPFLVTEFVEGQTLHDMLKMRGSLTVPEVLEISRQLLDGLEAIHRLGIIHRDIKPVNILVTSSNPPGVKILDFGIAKAVGTGLALQGTPRTDTGIVMGTPEFMSPEQACGDPVSPATDIYAFTLIVYQMILGKGPFHATTTLELLQKHLTEPPHIPEKLLPGIQELLVRGLAKKPSDRFESVAEMRGSLAMMAREVETTGSFLVTEGLPSEHSDQAVTPRRSLPSTERRLAVDGGAEAPQSTGPVVLSTPKESWLPTVGLLLVCLVFFGMALQSLSSSVPKSIETPADDPLARQPFMQLEVLGGYKDDDPTERLRKERDDCGIESVTKAESRTIIELNLKGKNNPAHFWGPYRITADPAGLTLDGTKRPGRFFTMLSLTDRAMVDLHYTGANKQGSMDVLLIHPSQVDPPIIYRVRVDLARSEVECLLSDPKMVRTVSTQEEGTSRVCKFEWLPRPWLRFGGPKRADISSEGAIQIALDGREFNVRVGAASWEVSLSPPFDLKPGPIYVHVYVNGNARLTLDRLTLVGQPVFHFVGGPD